MPGCSGEGGVPTSPGGLGGRGGTLGGFAGLAGAAAPGCGTGTGIVVRESSSPEAAFGSGMGMVVRAFSLASPAASMRMVSRFGPACEGRLMRMVSFLASPMRTVSFLASVGAWGRVMRMVSFLVSSEGAPGFGGRVMRTVAFLVGLGSDAERGESSAIVGLTCIARGRWSVNPWFQEFVRPRRKFLHEKKDMRLGHLHHQPQHASPPSF